MPTSRHIQTYTAKNIELLPAICHFLFINHDLARKLLMFFNMKNILICHHDPAYLSLISDFLRDKGYGVQATMDPAGVIPLLQKETIRLCMVDAMLPKKAGINLLQQLSRLFPHLPVLWLSPFHSREEQLFAYRNGCSDYVVMPADMELLMARMDALMRLVDTADAADLPTSFQLDNLAFDGERHRLGNRLLSARENDILLLLCRNLGKVVLRADILNALWGADDVFAARSLAVFMNRLRKYLGNDSAYRIVSIRNKGYKLIEDPL